MKYAGAEISKSVIEHDGRPIILFDTFGFDHTGHIGVNISKMLVSLPEGVQIADKASMGFFITTAEAEIELQNDLNMGQCVLDNPNIHKLFTLKEAETNVDAATGTYSLDYLVPEAYEYSLFFANCQNQALITMDVSLSLYNVEAGQKRDFLSSGKTQLPKLYLFFFLTFLAAGGAWAYLCFNKSNAVNVQRIHLLMFALIAMKALTCLAQAGEYAYIKATGIPHGWNVVYYVFSFCRGVMLFTVIVLIGTGWSFLKPFLQDKEKKIIMIVIPLQVMN